MKCPYRFMLSENQQECIRNECMLFSCGGYHKEENKIVFSGRCELSNDSETWKHTHEKEIEQ